MRPILALTAAALLAACGEASDPGAGGQPAPAVAPAIDAADAVAISDDQAEAREFAWEGRFAASPDLCRAGQWEIGSERIVTAGETACEVDNVARAAGQVTLELSCVAEGMPGDERWTLRPRGESGLRVRRETAAEASDVDLVRC